MLLTGPGTFKFILDAGPSHGESASVSSLEPATVEVFQNGDLVDKVYVSGGGTHSWWNTNPLLRRCEVGDTVGIVIQGKAAMRIDWPLRIA